MTVHPWYSFEDAKRQLGQLCQRSTTVTIGGGGARSPALVLRMYNPAAYIDDVKLRPISVERARADWSNVHIAVAVLGASLCICYRGVPSMVLLRHYGYVHPATAYTKED